MNASQVQFLYVTDDDGQPGDSVRVEFGPRHGDQYGRILYYLYNLQGESIDEMLVREGLARALTRDGQHRDVLVSAEEEARRDGRGCLW